ncbi:MAG: hypothetical protein D6686_01175 [Alphaproteobacteria bacterium]|nr:MAG: hypothetical protein D6686_01175 [Alphaproteobacteria bacterium]
MRPVILHDILRAAEVLRPMRGRRARRRRLLALIEEAERADRERRATGRSARGDGSLAGACRGAPAIRASFEDAEYCDCVALICRLLAARRRSEAGIRLHRG